MQKTITIITNGQKHEIEGRAAQIMRWLLQHLEQINAEGRGEIRVNYAGRSLVVSLKQVENL